MAGPDEKDGRPPSEKDAAKKGPPDLKDMAKKLKKLAGYDDNDKRKVVRLKASWRAVEAAYSAGAMEAVRHCLSMTCHCLSLTFLDFSLTFLDLPLPFH